MNNMTVADAIHLNQLHCILNSGVVLEAAKDWLRGEIYQMERDLGLDPVEAIA
ncbi:hypothetical protein ACFPES_03075 [Paenibacillus sp. GCM10023248]|uniref:hypothetical protein n=1 Tax=unclassified Paenibacillus TaxID=185978 RepID=UPI002379612F|nr:hypothetical protein [Paenibacillus sp. MAHUQ-63]MDD9266007.1 hypothetical protein [Paenibacillus sp. MAHUQ-63]